MLRMVSTPALIVFSSHELKTGVSFSDHLLSVVPCCVVVVVIVVVVNFSHFHLLLQNHWANSNQTWHKASLGEGNLSLFKWRALPFPRGDNYKVVKIHRPIWKMSFSRTTGPFSIKLDTSLGEGISVNSNERPHVFQGEIITK